MAALYQIEQELLNIFNEIEEAGGELTPELEEKLNITQDNFKEKLNNYYKAVLSFTSDANSIKEEIDRLNNRKRLFDGRVKRLKENMLNAVQLFGNEGKTGNRFIELPGVRLYTKGSKSTNVDEQRVALIIESAIEYLRRVYEESALVFGEEFDIVGTLAAINATIVAQKQFEQNITNNDNIQIEFIPFTETDLNTITINISTECTLMDFISKEDSILEYYLRNQHMFNIKHITIKETFKNAIEHYGIDEENSLTVAKIDNNQSLQMK